MHTSTLASSWARRLRGSFVGILTIACLLLPCAQANASIYGRNAYSSCKYQICDTTVVTTPTGLEVAINLTNNQEIPYAGYTVTITPLNGAGSTFKETRIYLDGVLVATVLPDSTGTARWLWDPNATPGTHISFEIVDTAGNITKQSFEVRIGPKAIKPASSGATTPSTPPSDEPTGLAGFIPAITNTVGQTYRRLQEIVKDLPPPIAESFPYFLFLILIVDIILLLLQLKREVRESQTLQQILNRARLLAEQKETFVALISHYLRTPLAILNGGVGLLKSADPSDHAVQRLEGIVLRIRKTIETLLTYAHQTHAQPIVSEAEVIRPSWRQPRFFLPLVLIGLTLIVFNILAISVGKFSHSQIQIIVQVIIFSTLALLTYQVLRRRHLHRNDTAALQRLLDQTSEVAHARDAIISQAVQSLEPDIQALNQARKTFAQSPNHEYIVSAIKQFQTTLAQLSIADKLKGIHTTQPPTIIKLSTLLQEASTNLKLSGRPPAVQLTTDLSFATPNPQLLGRVLADVLDNALAYSPSQTVVTVDATKTDTGVDIAVHDDGPGIPEQKMPLIFQPFYKAEGTLSFNHEGMGFSLYLDKIVMTYLGGDMSLESVPGKGTTAHLELGHRLQ